MRTAFIILICLLSAEFLTAQKEATYWYFGNHAGMKFSSNSVTPLTDGVMAVDEGCASISNKSGRLLFYTRGTIVYNRKHVKMKNGDGLYGDPSSTQNAVIVPQPGNDSLYYIFTVDWQNGDKGLNFSLVNMHGDNGYGEVIVKNTHLADSVYEKITAVANCSKDVWIAVKRFNSDKYLVFSLSRAGISGPVISSTGVVIGGVSNNSIGAMKFSNDGTKLAAVHAYQNDFVELLDFDNTTGILSNPRVFRADTSTTSISSIGSYGIEFSPNNRLLYTSSYSFQQGNSYLNQFDVSLPTGNAISNSKKLISQIADGQMAALQISIDKKIYLSMWGDRHISLINDPDVPDTGCHFVQDQLAFGNYSGIYCQGGLPSFVQSYFNSALNSYDFSRNGQCSDKTVQFTINKINGIDSARWNFGDNGRSTSLSPMHTYMAPGYYNVSLIVYKQDCSGQNDTILHSVYIAPSGGNFLGPDTSVCISTGLVLGFSVTDADYLWNTGSVQDTISADSSGIYWLEIQQNGCVLRDSITVLIKPPPAVNLGNDTTICTNHVFVLDAGNPGANYLWNTGSRSQKIVVFKTGTYSLTVTSDGCTASGKINVTTGICDLLLPTAFSPNGDGLNDEFGILNGVGIYHPDFRIFDRWGRLVFHTTDVGKRWDGTFKSQKLPIGVYIWTISYTDSVKQLVKAKGTVTLIR